MEPFCALSTPAGLSGIAVIRASGEDVSLKAEKAIKILRTTGERTDAALTDLKGYESAYARFTDPVNNKTIDDVRAFVNKVTDKTNCSTTLIDIEDNNALKKAIEECHILINATPVGMTSNKSLIDKSYLRKELVVCDLIYEPPMTKLLLDASEVGCRYLNGKYMLLYQGARSFKLWTNNDMPVKEVKAEYFS